MGWTRKTCWGLRARASERAPRAPAARTKGLSPRLRLHRFSTCRGRARARSEEGRLVRYRHARDGAVHAAQRGCEQPAMASSSRPNARPASHPPDGRSPRALPLRRQRMGTHEVLVPLLATASRGGARRIGIPVRGVREAPLREGRGISAYIVLGRPAPRLVRLHGPLRPRGPDVVDGLLARGECRRSCCAGAPRWRAPPTPRVVDGARATNTCVWRRLTSPTCTAGDLPLGIAQRGAYEAQAGC